MYIKLEFPDTALWLVTGSRDTAHACTGSLGRFAMVIVLRRNREAGETKDDKFRSTTFTRRSAEVKELLCLFHHRIVF